MKKVFSANPNVKLLVWIGARNQNHLIQQEIAKVASKDKRVFLLVKNQPWKNEEHWEGIVEHVLTGGIKKENLILCDRGFAPNGHNPNGYRNIPDFEMAMRIKHKYEVSMVFDPSHTGGSVQNVFKISQQASMYNFDGMIVEVHPDPKNALTDKKQQINWQEFDQLVNSSDAVYLNN
jgi:3-deoxy-D-arabino-heptulosonate 7-phosphate (DAHP) synthase